MDTRADKRRGHSTRAEAQQRVDGTSGDVFDGRVDHVVRDVTTEVMGLPKVTEDNVAEVLREVLEILRGPIARHIYEIGQFINERGEISRLSPNLWDELDEKYGP